MVQPDRILGLEDMMAEAIKIQIHAAAAQSDADQRFNPDTLICF
jgi:hypothetical protein